MDVDDEDAFLYGDAEEPSTSALEAPAAQSSAQPAKADAAAVSGLSASMAASLAAYGIDPSMAVAENPEDGGVEEEEDDDEEDSDSDEDDVKLVFTGGASRLDLRKPQQQQSNVIGIGKWAHTSTGAAAPTPAAPSTPAPVAKPAAVPPTANQTTEYTPASRPGQVATPTTATPATAATPVSAPIPLSVDGATIPNTALPASDLPPVTTHNGATVDPSNPSGVIPSTGNSVYDIDVSQFEGSGQPWRRPGADLQDWFNFGFDEVTYPKYLRYRQEMEAGRLALMNMQMGQMTPEVANLLHLPNPMMNMGNMPFNPQQLQAMQQAMAMGGMDPMMQQQQQLQQQQQHQQQMLAIQGGQQPLNGQGQGEVKREEGDFTTVSEPSPGFRGQNVAQRGGAANRGALAARGRGQVPSGPRAGMPAAIPKGPKAGRFRDKDKVENATSDLNYGDDDHGDQGSGRRSRSRTDSPGHSRSKRYRDRTHDDGYDSRGSRRSQSPSRDRERDRKRSSRRDRDDDYDDREKDRRREKRKRDEGKSASLGPGGWESEEETSRSSRRRRSPDSGDEEDRHSRRTKRK